MFGHQPQDDKAALPADFNPALPPEMLDAAAEPAPALPEATPITAPPVVSTPTVTPTVTPHDDVVKPASAATDLLSIKQQALKQLSPLVGHLDQTPEEKFRTTMMMIQASDDQSLLSQAYEAAQSITDEKTRAQALLDVVNEINYFTQHQDA